MAKKKVVIDCDKELPNKDLCSLKKEKLRDYTKQLVSLTVLQQSVIANIQKEVDSL